MPDARLARARETLPAGYQFGDGDIVDVVVKGGVYHKTLLVRIPRRCLPRMDVVTGVARMDARPLVPPPLPPLPYTASLDNID